MNKKDIRAFCQANKVFQYEIARESGISEFTLTRWLREEHLTPEREKTIRQGMKKIVERT